MILFLLFLLCIPFLLCILFHLCILFLFCLLFLEFLLLLLFLLLVSFSLCLPTHGVSLSIFLLTLFTRVREPLRKKYGIFWEFFPNVGPPSPPTPLFGRPPSKKKFKGLFCVLGPKEHFWFLQKCSLFVSILTYTFGNRGPPPPLQGKNSQIIPFLPIFFQN